MTMRSWIGNLYTHRDSRPIRKAPHQFRPALEVLEDRWVLSTLPSSALAVPGIELVEVMGPEGILVPLVTPGPTGYTPQQLQTAYGLNQVSFAGIQGDGAGQTIALVDAYDNPGFVNSTDPNFNTSTLHIFDQTFGLPDPPSFTKVNQAGQAAPLPPPNHYWGEEIAADIEQAHSMAPAASIILVEANDSSNNLYTAAAEAGTLASVVSMSWGFSENSGESSFDSTFQVPGVTYLAATGDHGAPGGYPAYSPHVVAVGGTSLNNLDANGDYPGTGTNGEVGWSLGSDPSAPTFGGGGGISQFEPEPSYQSSVQSTGQRTIPDISANADNGVAFYDPYDFGTVWLQIDGTSVASPLIAGMVAQADQGRVLSGGQTFSSDQVLADLYSLESSRPSDFHDIIYGYNGFNAGPGYDLVTGLGTPNGSQLVPDLAYFGLSTPPTLTSVVVTPSNPSVDQGFTQPFTATGTFASGVTQNITNSVVWASAMPSVATIDGSGLATTHAAGTSAITASLDGVTSPAVTLTSLALVSLVVTPSNPSVDQGFTQQFTAMGTFAGGSTLNLTSFVVWASATPSVATIDGSGLAMTHAAGTSVISALLDGVTSPGVTLTSLPLVVLAVAPNNPHVPVLLSVPFTVTGTYSDGSTHQFPSMSVAWASSNPTVATINSAGLATADALGFSVITASLFGVTSAGNVLTAVAPSFANFVVNTTADDLNYTPGMTTLREAILAADAYPGHTVTFDPAVFATAKTITLTLGQLELSDTTGTETIQGPNAGVTVSGNNATRVFEVDPAVTASLSGMTITGGRDSNGGGLYNNGANVTLTDCTVSGNSASNRGGGLYGPSYAGGSITLTDCTISDNSAGGSGGGLGVRSLNMAVTLTNCTVSGNSSGVNGGGMQVSGTATLTNCTVSGNTAAGTGAGGGLLFEYGSVSLTNCTVSGNSSGRNGGGLVFAGSSATLTNCTVLGNSADGGGGLYAVESTTTLTNCTVSGNSAYAVGGGLLSKYGTTTLTNCTISGNSVVGFAPYGFGGGLYFFENMTALTNCTISGNSILGPGGFGGGLECVYGNTTMTNCTVNNNSVGESTYSLGGGVLCEFGTATLANCTISGNSILGTGLSGGGGFADFADNTTLINCTISGNSDLGPEGSGGGLELEYGTTTLNNCTISGNSAGDYGGGLANYGDNTTLQNCTVSGNSAANGGGGLYTFNNQYPGQLLLTNTIIAGNTNLTSAASDISGSAAGTNNLIGAGGSGGLINGTGGNLVGVANVLLAPLGSYGGPTQTMPLLPGSPAINAGTSTGAPALDQRGQGRVGAVDIGAFESQGFTIAVISGSGQTTNIATAFAAPLVVRVTANNPSEPVAGGRVTFTPPSSGASATISGSPATISSARTASVAATANGFAGSYTVSATARGITTPASFGLSNRPTITRPAAQTAYQNVDQSVSGISIGDAPGAHLTVTLSVSHGTLTLGTTTGLTMVTGNGSGTVTLTGTTGDLNAALASLVYRGNHNFSGGDTLSLTATDSGVSATPASVALTIESIAQEVANLRAQVSALQAARVLSSGQAALLNATLNLSGNAGDDLRVAAFLVEVQVLRSLGILTQAQANALLGPGNILLLSVIRR